eukprot:7580388-Alexandrium_andersonii.AAC.1
MSLLRTILLRARSVTAASPMRSIAARVGACKCNPTKRLPPPGPEHCVGCVWLERTSQPHIKGWIVVRICNALAIKALTGLIRCGRGGNSRQWLCG